MRRRGGGRHWVIGIENEFREVEIIRDEGDENLPGEGEVVRGEAASAMNVLSDEDCEFELP
ncbi:hypothetical protein KY290_003629 [Solanum tuberosum]|uniref:Uncharacterized protein n=1 Tax=Solanum tuberosum TaxID=4113 RepID=A0ABQ7WTG2_SOLTU|nr:hypothetical protein KY289_003875 [Solanum tuberosum]KAH0767760.1 hypothetical protein KY285_003631 [Solanum tuberosum]KAH0784031.1 hypothetical protein KY290_003629 [Solanum tuberosum]